MHDHAPGPSPRIDQLYAWVMQWARNRPQADAGIEPGRRLTWSQLKKAIDEAAAAMISAGVEPGDRVATLAVPGLDFLITFLATAAVGGIWVGLNPRYADPELDAVIHRTGPKLVFATDQIDQRAYRTWTMKLPASIQVVILGTSPEPGDRVMSWLDFIARGTSTSESHLGHRCRSTTTTDPCLIVFTSGSTGTPKGALISQASLVGASQVQLRAWPADPLRVLVNLPINHIGCVGDLCCYTLVGGGCMVFTPRFDPSASLAVICDEQVTVWGQVPTMFQLTLDAPLFDPARLTSLQLIFWGGAHAPPQLIDRLRSLAPRLGTSYSQTETVGSVTFTPADAGTTTLHGTVGRAFDPYQVRIANAEDHPLPAGREGEVQVRTPFGMSGYWRDPMASAAVITADGWQRTGDVGTLAPTGDLRLLGRVHDVFKSGGYNIHPPEIESALAAFPGVEQAAVVGVPDPLYGNVPMAFLVAAGTPPAAEELQAHLRGRLANYKVPKHFLFVDDLPRLAVGKIDKQALRALAGGHHGH